MSKEKTVAIIEVSTKFVEELNKSKTLTKSYTFDLDMNRDDYIHVFRNDSNKNAFQCYLKHTKKQVYILANTKLFDTFTSDIEFTTQKKNAQLTRYIVSYDNFIKFTKELLKFDSNRTSTTVHEKAQNEQVAI